MAYTPKTWVCGEVITAEDLNHLENGLANASGGCLFVSGTMVGNDLHTQSLDKTPSEIKEAYLGGHSVIFKFESWDAYYRPQNMEFYNSLGGETNGFRFYDTFVNPNADTNVIEITVTEFSVVGNGNLIIDGEYTIGGTYEVSGVTITKM